MINLFMYTMFEVGMLLTPLIFICIRKLFSLSFNKINCYFGGAPLFSFVYLFVCFHLFFWITPDQGGWEESTWVLERES